MSERFGLAGWDQRTLAFYGTLLGLVLLDIILLFWILNPFTRVGTAVLQPARAERVVSDVSKPSPFEGSPRVTKPVKTRKARAASTPAFVDARLQDARLQ